MKLSKIYCNKPFHNTEFNFGLNVIYADVRAKSDPNSSHNLGKSKLIELIDFLLLKGVTPKTFFLTSTKDSVTNTPKFNGYEFYLELLLNDGRFVTVKRTTNESSKVSMKVSSETTQGFTIPTGWDHSNITMPDAKVILNGYLAFDFFADKPMFDYRDTVNYSLRMHRDYSDIFQLEKFRFDDRKWKALMFYLLDFDGSVLLRKYDKEVQIKEKQKVITEQEQNFNIQSNQKDEVEGFLQVLKTSKGNKIKELESLDFYNQDNATIVELIEEIESRISELNKVSYNLQFEIKKIRESLNDQFSFDLNTVKDVFEEVSLHFPDQLLKSYEELVEFNKQITSERRTLLNESLKEKNEQLNEVKQELIELNNKKDTHREIIQDNSVLKKLRFYQGDLLKIENDIARHEAQLDAIRIIESKKSEIEELKDELGEIIQEVKDIVANTLSNGRYIRIRNYFSEYANKILANQAIISISVNQKDNVDFNYKVGETRKSDGNTYRKMLCIAFDLAILAEYSNQSYFKFVYHDDVFSNQENKIRVRLVNLLREYCTKFNIQYIFSIIKDDLPRDSQDNILPFDSSEIIMELHDRSEDGKLFRVSF